MWRNLWCALGLVTVACGGNGGGTNPQACESHAECVDGVCAGGECVDTSGVSAVFKLPEDPGSGQAVADDDGRVVFAIGDNILLGVLVLDDNGQPVFGAQVELGYEDGDVALRGADAGDALAPGLIVRHLSDLEYHRSLKAGGTGTWDLITHMVTLVLGEPFTIAEKAYRIGEISSRSLDEYTFSYTQHCMTAADIFDLVSSGAQWLVAGITFGYKLHTGDFSIGTKTGVFETGVELVATALVEALLDHVGELNWPDGAFENTYFRIRQYRWRLPQDAVEISTEACGNYADDDGDGYNNSVDCDESDAAVWKDCVGCVDGDGDGHFAHDAVNCSGGDDHCDSDPDNWSTTGCTSCSDTDGDGRGMDCDRGSDCDETDDTVWTGCPGCADGDGDGHDAYDSVNCPTGDDLCDSDANNWTNTGCSSCVDNDFDGYGTNCDKGPDCADNDNAIHTGCPGCVDSDGDGHDAYDSTWCPAGDDHCDADEDNWTTTGCTSCVDNDGDGRGTSCDKGGDCNDGDNTIWTGCPGCSDGDGDGHDGYHATNCPGGDDYCDTDGDNWTTTGCSSCVDNDNDGYGTDCDKGPDCNDNDGAVVVPLCTNRECGPDGCGGTCAPGCSSGYACNSTSGQCECVPDCSGKNCGDDGCGGSCGSCTSPQVCDAGGTCGPQTPIQISSDVGTKAMVVVGSMLYFTKDWGLYSGEVMSMPASGGTATSLVQGLSYANSIAADAVNIYYGREESSAPVNQIPVGGGTPVAIAAGQSNPKSFQVDATHVYWGNRSTGEIKKVPIGGGTITTLVAESASVEWVTDVALGPSYVYYCGYYNNTNVVRKVPIGGGSITTLATNELCKSIAYYDGKVYWVATVGSYPDSIHMINSDGTGFTALADSFGSNLYELAVDADGIYVADYGCTGGCISEVYKVLHGSGTPLVIAENLDSPRAVALDSSYVYIAALRQIYRTPK